MIKQKVCFNLYNIFSFFEKIDIILLTNRNMEFLNIKYLIFVRYEYECNIKIIVYATFTK